MKRRVTFFVKIIEIAHNINHIKNEYKKIYESPFYFIRHDTVASNKDIVKQQ